MRRDAVIFDLFGTLVPPFSLSQHGLVIRRMSATLGLPEDSFEQAWVEAYEERRTGRATIAEQLRNICCLLGRPEVPESALQDALDVRVPFFRESLVPRPIAVTVLEHLRGRGLKLGLISDTSSETSVLWESTPLAAMVDVAVFSCEAGCHKPDPRIYRAAWEALEVDPTRCMYVGDGMSQELSGAQRVGMEAVLLSVEEERDAEAEFEPWDGPTVASLGEVLLLV